MIVMMLRGFNMNDKYFKRVAMLLLNNWSVSPVSMYDEEGVEGWHWESPTGEDYYEMGGWDELPEMNDDIIKVADKLIEGLE